MHKLNYLILNLWIHLAKFEAWFGFGTDQSLFKLMGHLTASMEFWVQGNVLHVYLACVFSKVNCDSINFIVSVWITRGWTPGQSTIHVPDNGWNIQHSWWIQQVCFCDQYNSFHTIIRQGPFNPYCFSWAVNLWILYRNKH